MHLTDDYYNKYFSTLNVIFDRAPWFSEFVYPYALYRTPYKSLPDFILNYWQKPQIVIFCVGRCDVDESFKPHKSKEQLENVLKNRELIYNQINQILIDLILITKSNITFKIYDFEKDDLEDVFTFLET